MKKYILATHINPDYDGISSIIGFLDYLMRNDEVELWQIIFQSSDQFTIYFPDELPKDKEWLTRKYRHANIIDKSFDGVLIFDSTPEGKRLGIDEEIIKYYNEKDKIFSIDHHPYNNKSNRLEHLLPSTTCCLIEEGIIEDVLYLGIWSDTFYLNYRLTESLYYLNKLIKKGLNNKQIAYYNTKTKPIKNIGMHKELIKNVKYKIYNKNKNKLCIWVIVNKKLKYNSSFENIVNYFKEYCDVLIVSDMISKRISFRSKTTKYDVSKLAQNIRGNGHRYSAGAYLCKMKSREIKKTIISLINEEILSN